MSRNNKNHLEAPPEFSGWIFYWLDRLYPNWIRRYVTIVISMIAPNIPIGLSNILKNKKYLKTFLAAWLTTFFFCFVVNLALAASHGTLRGNDPDYLYFLQDKADLWEYTVICPTQVAFASLLIMIIICKIDELNLFAQSLQKGVPKNKTKIHNGSTIPIALFYTFFISLFIITNFIAESLNNHNYVKHFWYIERITASNERILGLHGIYYAFINFILAFIAIFAVLMYLRIFIAALKIGNTLNKLKATTNIKFDDLKKGLMPFTQSYIIAKILALFYMINWFTWQYSNPTKSINVVAYGLLLSIVGLVIIPIPRHFIQLKWYHLSIRKAKTLKDTSAIAYDDIRPRKIHILAGFINLFFSISFLSAVWNYTFLNFIK